MRRREFISLTVGYLSSARVIWGAVAAGPNFPLRPGEKFVFKTIKAASEASGPATFETSRGQAFMVPLPLEQTVSIRRQPGGSTPSALVIEADVKLPAFISGVGGQSYPEKIKAAIDAASGAVMNIETAMTIGDSVSRSTQISLPHESTLCDFYGPWMLDLTDGYNKSANTEGRGRVQLKVSGRQRVLGRDCFLVKQTTFSGDQFTESTVWVDVRSRTTVRTIRDGMRMDLISRS